MGLYEFWNNFLHDSGCLDQIKADAEVVVREIFDGKPSMSPLFTDDAKLCMKKNYIARMQKLYMNSIIIEIQEALRNYDIEESITLRGKNFEAVKRDADDARKKTSDYSSSYFRDKYSLFFSEYEGNIRRNFINSMKEFLDHLSEFNRLNIK